MFFVLLMVTVLHVHVMFCIVTYVHDIATKIGGVCNLNVRKIRMNLAEVSCIINLLYSAN